jgi:hypothetical protein
VQVRDAARSGFGRRGTEDPNKEAPDRPIGGMRSAIRGGSHIPTPHGVGLSSAGCWPLWHGIRSNFCVLEAGDHESLLFGLFVQPLRPFASHFRRIIFAFFAKMIRNSHEMFRCNGETVLAQMHPPIRVDFIQFRPVFCTLIAIFLIWVKFGAPFACLFGH